MSTKFEIIFLGLALVFLVEHNLQAQDMLSKKITWKVNGAKDLKANKSFEYACEFETDGKGNITWIQDGGKSTSTFKINSIEGGLESGESYSKVICKVNGEEGRGTITIDRGNSGTRITVDLASESYSANQYQFSVSQTIER